jgi:phage tail-like protein
MGVLRDNPYGAFNFLVEVDGLAVGGFSDVSGLGAEIAYADYRNGNEPTNAVGKIPGLHKFADVTLKRGIVGSTDLFQWLKQVADGTPSPRNVTIILLDEARQAVLRWKLRRAQPKKWAGPHLAAAAAGVIAMEELVLVHEGLEME